MTPQPPSPQASGRIPSSLPLIAMICSILCVPPLGIIGLILGIVALVQNKGSKTMAIIAVVLQVLIAPVGILAAIAIPNFIKFQSRSKQSECKANLKAALMSERSYEAEKGQFDPRPAEVGFAPERGNRYLYAFAMDGKINMAGGRADKDDVGVGADTGKYPTVSNEALRDAIPQDLVYGLAGTKGITIVCAGNIDNDATIDVWSISTEDRPGMPAGTPFNHVNDVNE